MQFQRRTSVPPPHPVQHADNSLNPSGPTLKLASHQPVHSAPPVEPLHRPPQRHELSLRNPHAACRHFGDLRSRHLHAIDSRTWDEQAQALSRRLFPQLTTGSNVNRVHETYRQDSGYRLPGSKPCSSAARANDHTGQRSAGKPTSPETTAYDEAIRYADVADSKKVIKLIQESQDHMTSRFGSEFLP